MPPGSATKAYEYLKSRTFRTKKCRQVTHRSRIPIRRLFDGQSDVAAYRTPACVPGAAVGGFHEARATAGHHGEPQSRDASPDPATDVVIGMPLGAACGAEDGHARPDEMQRPKARDELVRGLQHEPELTQT